MDIANKHSQLGERVGGECSNLGHWNGLATDAPKKPKSHKFIIKTFSLGIVSLPNFGELHSHRLKWAILVSPAQCFHKELIKFACLKITPKKKKKSHPEM